jgi:hypothetical protein
MYIPYIYICMYIRVCIYIYTIPCEIYAYTNNPIQKGACTGSMSRPPLPETF